MRLDRGAGFISKAEQQIKGNHFCLKGKTAEGRYHPLLYSRYTSWDAAEYAADCHRYCGELSAVQSDNIFIITCHEICFPHISWLFFVSFFRR